MENRISIDSPIGMALKGHKIGDRVEVKVNDSYSYFLEIRSIDKTHSEEEEKMCIRDRIYLQCRGFFPQAPG